MNERSRVKAEKIVPRAQKANVYPSGALVAKSVSLPNTRLLLFLGAHSFTRCRTSYPTLPLFPVFTNLITLSDIFEVKISRLDQRSEVPPPIAPTTPDCWGARGYRVL
jgi:hypothetical protein